MCNINHSLMLFVAIFLNTINIFPSKKGLDKMMNWYIIPHLCMKSVCMNLNAIPERQKLAHQHHITELRERSKWVDKPPAHIFYICVSADCHSWFWLFNWGFHLCIRRLCVSKQWRREIFTRRSSYSRTSYIRTFYISTKHWSIVI